MKFYPKQTRFLFAVDCVLFGFDGDELKVLLSKRTVDPMKGKWGLIGGIVNEKQSADEAVKELLTMLTGLNKLYIEQLHAFTDIGRETTQRTISLTYFALIDIRKYKQHPDEHIRPRWFSIDALPELIVEHNNVLKLAKERLKYSAAKRPLLFELLPPKFTIPQLYKLYETVFDIQLDRRNLERKLKQTNILIRLAEKDKLCSKRGAFYYKLSVKNIKNFNEFGSIVPLKYHLLA